MPPVNVDFTPTPQDYARALRSFYLSTRSYRVMIFFFSFLILLVLMIMPPIWLAGEFPPEGIFGVALGLIFPGIVLGSVLLSPWLTAQRLRKDERSLAPSTYQFDDECMTCTDKFCQTRFDWGSLGRVIETPDDFLLIHRTHANIFHFVAKRTFASTEQENEFRTLLRAHVKKYEDRRNGMRGWVKGLIATGAFLMLLFSVAMTVTTLTERGQWKRVGVVEVPSGSLLVADPSYLPEVDDTLMTRAQGIKPGSYPVEIQIRNIARTGDRVWRARVLFKEGVRSASRRLGSAATDSATLAFVDPHFLNDQWVTTGPLREACVIGADKAKVSALAEADGYHVRADGACVQIIEPLSEPEEQRLNGLIDAQGYKGYVLLHTGNSYDRLSDALKQTDYQWGALPFEDGREAWIVAFESGQGDGEYPVYGLYQGSELVGMEVNMGRSAD